jgi:hypothetical protein
MTLELVLAIALIAVPVMFNWTFAELAKQFEYPEILRQPTSDVLAKFRAGGSRLVLTWWLFAMSALAFGLLAVLLPIQLDFGVAETALIATLGLLAAMTQFLGLVRWPFMVPHLAREAEHANEAKHAAIDVVFQSLNRYLGVAVGEHLGYLFTGLWTAALGGVLLSNGIESQLGWQIAFGLIGLALGLLLVLCSLEFVGKNELNGWKLAGAITPFVYIAWSLWLVGLGVTLFILMVV